MSTPLSAAAAGAAEAAHAAVTAPDPAAEARSAAATEALLHGLLWLCRHHGVACSRVALLAPLGLEDRLTPTQAPRLLEAAGLQARWVSRDATAIHDLLLPALLLLRDGSVAVLLGRQDSAGDAQADSTPRWRVLLPQDDSGHGIERLLDAAELRATATGEVLLSAPVASGTAAGEGSTAVPAGRHWLWHTLRRYTPYYRGAMLAALISNVLMLVSGLFTSVVYDRVIPHQAMVTLWSLAAAAGLAVAFDLVARQLRSYLIDLAARKADLALGSLLFRQAGSIRLEHRPDSTGSFAHHLAQLEIVREFSTSATMSALSDAPFILLFIGVTWAVAGELVVVLLLAVPLILLLGVGVQHLLRQAALKQQQQFADMHGLLVEAVDGIETLRACGAQNHFQTRYERNQALAVEAQQRARTLSNWVNNVTMVSQQLVTVVMLVWGVHLIQAGQLTGGALIAAVMFGGRAIAPLGSVIALASRYQAARAALRMLDQMMQQPVEREPGRRWLPLPALRGDLALRDVSFAYSNAASHAAPSADAHAGHAPQVLKGVQLQIRAGERVAILGKIGSGKSTVLRLLAGLYQPVEGLVEVDGLDLRQIDPADYRAGIGFVEQEPRLFRGSLRDNILLGRTHADVRALPEVLQLTGLDRLVAAHPAGLDMPVGEGGALLSGGQRQLVALARCLITRPRVLLMDEPTSSMDAQTESQFVQHLRAIGQRCTLVVVTHRPALLELVDRVAVIDAGRVVIDGPKAPVLAALSGRPVGQGVPVATAQAARSAADAAASAAVATTLAAMPKKPDLVH